MKLKFFLRYIFGSLLLLQLTNSVSSQATISGTRYVCPESEETYLVTTSSVCEVDQIHWSVSGGDKDGTGGSAVNVLWPLGITSGQVSVDILYKHSQDYNCNTASDQLSITGLYLDAVNITNKAYPDIPIDESRTFTAELEGTAKEAYRNPEIRWSITTIDGSETIINSDRLPTGSSLDLDLSQFATDIEDYLNTNIRIVATYSVCGEDEEFDSQQFKPTFPAPTSIEYDTIRPSCDCCSDGRVVINSVIYRGTKYNSSNAIPDNVPVMNFYLSNQGNNSFEIKNVSEFPVVFDGSSNNIDIYSSSEWMITAVAAYAYTDGDGIVQFVEGDPENFKDIDVKKSNLEFSVDLDSVPPDCSGKTASLIADVSISSSNLSYTFTGPSLDTTQSSNTVSGLSSNGNNSYSVTVVDENNPRCLDISDNTIIIFPTGINVISTTPNDPNCNGGDGTITVYAQGGTGTIQFKTTETDWVDGTVIPEITPVQYRYISPSLTTGIEHTVNIRDGNECPQSTSATLTNPDPISVAINGEITHPQNCNPETGQVSVVASNVYINSETLYPTFVLYDADEQGNIINTESAISQGGTINVTSWNSIFNPAPGRYIIQVRHSCDNETAQTDSFTINPAIRPIIPTNNVSAPDVPCFHGRGQISLTGFSYNGSNYNPSSSSGFSYAISDINNYPAIDDFSSQYEGFNVTHETPAYLFVINDNSLCISEPYEVNIGGPTNEISITPIISQASCYDQDSINLSANVTGGIPGYSYKWKDINDQQISENENINVWEGTYELKIVDANNCGFGKIVPDGSSFTKSFTATRPQPLNIYIESATEVDSTGKANGTVVLGTTFNESFVKYSADNVNFVNNSLFTGLDAGVHTFYIQNGNLCTNSIDVTIGTAPPFSANVSSVENISCKGSFDGKVTLEASGGILPYTFEISGNGIQRAQNESLFENLPAGEYNLKVSYTGVNTYTSDLGTIELTEPTEALSANITDYVNAVCGEARGSATVTASGGTPGYSYLWGILSNNQAGQTAENLVAGVHSVTVTDVNGCTAVATIELYDPAGPVLSQTGSTPVPCHYSTSGGGATLSVSGGAAPYDVYWPALNLHDSVAIDIAAGNYTAVVTDATNCSYTLSDIKVSAPSELLISFDAFNDPACYNDSDGEITASATGGTPPYQFVWQGITNAGNTGIVSGLPAGVYDLNLTDAHNCLTQGNFELKNPDEIVINLPDSVFICAGQTATLDAGNLGSFYQWTSPNGFSSDKQIVNLPEQGDYTVTVSNVEGCSNSKKVHLKYENRQFDAAFLLASQATMIDTIVLIEISWPIPDSLEWYITDDFLRLVDGGAYKELIPLETGEYTVGLRAWLAGCEDIVEKTITIVPADGQKELKVAKVDLIQSAKLFPNPNTGNFEVEVKLAYEADIRADLFSVKGLRIIPTKYDSGKKDYLIGFNLMRLEPGVYFVNVSAGDEVRKLKFVVN